MIELAQCLRTSEETDHTCNATSAGRQRTYDLTEGVGILKVLTRLYKAKGRTTRAKISDSEFDKSQSRSALVGVEHKSWHYLSLDLPFASPIRTRTEVPLELHLKSMDSVTDSERR